MPFFSDLLRVVGGVAAPVLAASGVGVPLAIAIGATIAAGTNVGAQAIERADYNHTNDQAARRLQEEADKKITEQHQAREAERAKATQSAHTAVEQSELPNAIINACSQRNLTDLPGLLSHLTEEQFEALGLRPLAACPDTATRKQVQILLTTEMNKRDQLNHRPTHRP